MKLKKPFLIKNSAWDALNKREKKYLILLFERKWAKEQMMDKLFIDNERTFRRLAERVRFKVHWSKCP